MLTCFCYTAIEMWRAAWDRWPDALTVNYKPSGRERPQVVVLTSLEGVVKPWR